MYITPARGYRKSSPVVTIAVGSTPQTIYIQTASLIGGRTIGQTAIIRKIMAYNNVGATTLDLGTGLAGSFIASLPTFRLVNACDNEWIEEEIPEVEISGDITAQTDVAGVLIQIEVEVIG